MRLEKMEQGQFGGFGGVIESGFKKESIQKTKVNLARKVELTERDFGIFEFILDMKFARVSDVFTKFFKKTLSAEDAKSEAWAKKRLFQLEQAQFLKSTYSNLGADRYFTVTRKGHLALANVFPERCLTKPIRGFDSRTLTHDCLLIDCRLAYEKNENVTDWISDRQLRTYSARDFGLTSLHVPDAIYKMRDGTRVAFELEIARKSKVRYREKIEKYVSLIRERRSDPRMFKMVRYLCTNISVAEILKSESDYYGDLISVETADFVSMSKGVRS